MYVLYGMTHIMVSNATVTYITIDISGCWPLGRI
jgi:hypothetical protein